MLKRTLAVPLLVSSSKWDRSDRPDQQGHCQGVQLQHDMGLAAAARRHFPPAPSVVPPCLARRPSAPTRLSSHCSNSFQINTPTC
jgi:hypothetical protein